MSFADCRCIAGEGSTGHLSTQLMEPQVLLYQLFYTFTFHKAAHLLSKIEHTQHLLLPVSHNLCTEEHMHMHA